MCGLTGGDGDGELNGAEVPKDPGMLTGAELWNWLLPKTHEEQRRHPIMPLCETSPVA